MILCYLFGFNKLQYSKINQSSVYHILILRVYYSQISFLFSLQIETYTQQNLYLFFFSANIIHDFQVNFSNYKQNKPNLYKQYSNQYKNKKMSQYNAYNSKNYDDTSSFSHHAHHSTNESSKLYSSERLTHADLPSNSKASQPTPVSTTQLYHNLNNSLDGLLSKIQAIKQEHTVTQKIPKAAKKMNMDVSGFPMPNLTQNQYLSGKPLFAPSFAKPRQNLDQQWEKKQVKVFQIPIEDNKAVSPPTQTLFSKSKSSKQLNENYTKINVFEPTSSKQIDKEHLRAITKIQVNHGLMSIPASNLKVSMEISPEQYHHFTHTQNELQLDKIIEKETLETGIIKKSIIFGDKISLKDFQLGKNVGSGKFGDVHICRHRATGAMFALKKIFKSTILEYNMVNQFTRQLKIHYRLDHPNIIKLYTHFDDQYHVFLLMEYAEGGILLDKLKCTEEAASRFVDQTIDAVQYLHKLKIAHRDIKPENIVLQFGDVVKLCDFGWASFYQNQMKTTFCGTLDYLSPEMKEGGQYDNSVDIWSMGVLTFQLLTGNPPYRKELMMAMKNGIGPSKPGAKKINWSIKYPPFISPMAQSFIRNLLKQNPEQRATLRFCSTHTFLKKYRQNFEQLSLFNELNPILQDSNISQILVNPTTGAQNGNLLSLNWKSSAANSINAFGY